MAFRRTFQERLISGSRYRTRVNADGGVVEALTCANPLDADVVMIPSGYKATKLYSQIGTDGVDDFDVSRNSIATRVNKLGLIEEVAIDVPRLDYSDSNCPSLLLEPQSTNLLTYSEDFSNAVWVNVRGIVSESTEIAPNGNTSFELFDTSDNNTHLCYQSVSTTIGLNYSFSCYIKKGTIDFAGLAFNASQVDTVFFDVNLGVILYTGTNIISSSIVDAGNGWYRCGIVVEASQSSHLFRVLTVKDGTDYSYIGDGTNSIIFNLAQVEVLPYATSYIPTVGSTVTRIKDAVTGAGDTNSFNSEEGVLYVEMAAFADDGTNRTISLNDGSTNNKVALTFNSGGGVQGEVKVGGVNIAVMAVAETTTNYNKVAIKWKAADFALWINGVKVDSQLSGISFGVGVLTKINLDNGSGANVLYSKVKALKVFTTALSDAQLETLTT